MVDRRLNEVAGNISFVVATVLRRPPLRPHVAIRKSVGGLEITVRHLRCEDDRYPLLERVSHLYLRLDDVRIAVRIDHERDTHGLYRLVDPCVREHITLVPPMRFPTVRLGCFDKVVEAAIATVCWNVRALAVIDAMRNPVNNQRLSACAPQ